MKCKYCGMYLENVDEESPNGMAHTIKCQTKRIHELENEKAAQIGVKPHDKYSLECAAKADAYDEMVERVKDALSTPIDMEQIVKQILTKPKAWEEGCQ